MRSDLRLPPVSTPGLMLGALLSLAACGGGAEPPAAERVVLITCDTLRADHLGAYGSEQALTPHLDAFAEGSVVFDSAWSTASLTLPSLASLMTGRLPDELGMISNRVLVPAEPVTIAEAISAAGIRTHAVVSNWVLRRRAEGAGGIEQGFLGYDADFDSVEENRPTVRERLAGGTTDAAVAWLEEHAAERFFLWVHYQDPHGPYTPPARYLEGIAERARPGDRALRAGNTNIGLGDLPKYQVLADRRDPAFYRARYAAEVRYFDEELGRLLDALERTGAAKGALVVFTADHGESLGEHDYWFSHGQTLYGELVRVPFLVRYPDGAPRPATSQQDGLERAAGLVSHLDLHPTLVEALGLPAPLSHGHSLLTDALPADRVVPSQLRDPREPDRWEAVTDGRHRLLVHAGGLMLFDVEADPEERSNLAALLPDTVADLRRRAAAMTADLPALTTRGAETEFSEEDLKLLQGLGYGGDDGH